MFQTDLKVFSREATLELAMSICLFVCSFLMPFQEYHQWTFSAINFLSNQLSHQLTFSLINYIHL